MPSGPKSIHSLRAGLRASGKGWASVITPTRMSTRSKSAHVIVMEVWRLLHERHGGQRGEDRAGVVVLHDLPGRVALLRHGLGAPLIEADSMAIATTHEPGRGLVDRHGKERALERVVAEEAPELVAALNDVAARAFHGDPGHPERHAALEDAERRDGADRDAASAESGCEIGEPHVETPGVVRRLRGKLHADGLERRHVARGEDDARILGVASTVRVVEGREELTLP